MNAQAPQISNMQARANLLSSALRQNYKSPLFTQQGTQQFRQKLQNIGILTDIDILVTVNLANSGASIAAPALGAPYNLVSNITLRDYNNDARVNISGQQLSTVSSVRHGKRWGMAGSNNAVETVAYGAPLGYPVVPSIPAAAGAVAGTATCQFWLRVPVSYSRNDLRGAMLMQNALGEAYLQADIATAFGTFDSPYNQNTVTVTSWSVQFVQNYLQPQVLTTAVVPQTDLSTVYELASMTTSTDLAANQYKLINYPNSRVVVAGYFRFANGAYNFGTDMGAFQQIASGNTILKDEPPILNFLKLREMLREDPLPGLYYIDNRDVPIATDLYGQVQARFQPSSVQAGAYFDVVYESFYGLGITLPGLNG